MKKRLPVICIILLIVISYMAIHLTNDHIAEKMRQQLVNCPLPEWTSLLDSRSIAGKMLGNGNGMQWFGIILLKSPLDEASLSDWFNDNMDVDKNAEYITILKQDSPYIFEFSDRQFAGYTSEDGCYQVRFVKESSVGSEGSFWDALLNCDLRGH